jgi:excisionase family DNA binding protein
MAQNEPMTIKEVAAYMRVDYRTVQRWIELKRLNASRIGRTVRIERSDLIRAMDRHEYEGAAPKHDPAMG